MDKVPIDRQVTDLERRRRLFRNVAYAAAGIGLLALLGFAFLRSASSGDDEAPIIVKNGSMDILAGNDTTNTWAWNLEPSGDNVDREPSYSHEPANHYFDLSKDLWVKVILRTGTCTAAPTNGARQVVIDFSEDNFKATVKRGKSGILDYRTKIRPSGQLTLDTTQTPQTLRYGTKGVGYITSVKSGGWSCDFPNGDALDQIRICSSGNRQDCQ